MSVPRRLLLAPLIALAVGAAAACTGSSTPAPVVSATLPSPTAYATQALDLIGTNLFVDANWPAVRAVALQRVEKAVRTTDTYAALRDALAAAGQRAGDLVSTADMTTVPPSTAQPMTSSTDRITTITLPGFVDLSSRPGSGQPTSAERSYVRRGSAVIANATALTTCGWIVDVRGNGSTDVPVMVGSVAALLPSGPTLVEVDRVARSQRIGLQGDAVTIGTEPVMPLDPVHPITQPVVVLQDSGTTRAGEAVVLAFHARDRSRSIGTPTFGQPTDGVTELLPDGAHLYIARSTMGDRRAQLAGGPIAPDDLVTDPAAQLTAARSWLQGQCR